MRPQSLACWFNQAILPEAESGRRAPARLARDVVKASNTKAAGHAGQVVVPGFWMRASVRGLHGRALL
jgi:hypothetical protein